MKLASRFTIENHRRHFDEHIRAQRLIVDDAVERATAFSVFHQCVLPVCVPTSVVARKVICC